MTSKSKDVDPQVRALLAGLRNLRKGLNGANTQAVCRSNLRKHVVACLSDNHISKTIIDKHWDQLSEDHREWLISVCYDALRNEAPQVAEFEVAQDCEAYPVYVRGVPGVYFIDGGEGDPLGPFATLELAEDAVNYHYWGLAQPKGLIGSVRETELPSEQQTNSEEESQVARNHISRFRA